MDRNHILPHFPSRNDVITRTFICNGVVTEKSLPIAKKEAEKIVLPLIKPTRPIKDSKYVLVDESQFTLLSEFEKKHRKDIALLAEHDLQPDTTGIPMACEERFPVPAARRAVHDVCEAEMRTISAKIAELNAAWIKHSKENHFNKPHLFQRETYLKRAPKVMKRRTIDSAVHEWLLRKERDTMCFEDDMSRLVGKYVEVQIRRRDYDRYYVLAGRFGIWSAQEYYRAPRPGKRYWALVTDGALKLQKLWTVYWAITRLRRYRSCRLIQTAWRCSYHYRRLNPLIKLRVKYGKRSVMKFFWIRWHEYNNLCRKIKDALRFQFSSWRDKCFNAWKDWLNNKKKRKEDVIKKFVLRMKNLEIVGCFLRWTVFTARRKRGKLFLRRLFQCPHFDMWHQYAIQSKKHKKRSKAAAAIQACVRMFHRRKQFVSMKVASKVLDRFFVYAFAHFVVRNRRRQQIALEFEEWAPEETVRRQRAAAEIERRRIVRQQQVVKEKEDRAVHDLKKHWRSKDGKVQLMEVVMEIRSGECDLNAFGITKPKKHVKEVDLAKRVMLRQCKHLSYVQERHEFNVKSPPHIVCPHPMCGRVFTNDEQYVAHCKSSAVHNPLYVPSPEAEPEGEAEAVVLASKSKDSVDSVGRNAQSVDSVTKQQQQLQQRHQAEGLEQRDEEAVGLFTIERNSSINSKAERVELLPVKRHSEVTVNGIALFKHGSTQKEESKLGLGENYDEFNDEAGASAMIADYESNLVTNELNPNPFAAELTQFFIDDAVVPFPLLHLQLRNQLGIEILRSYLIRIRGIDSAVNCLDLWVAIEEWRQKSVYSEQYKSKALNILETYLCVDCSRPLQLWSEEDQHESMVALVHTMTVNMALPPPPRAGRHSIRTSTRSASNDMAHVAGIESPSKLRTSKRSGKKLVNGKQSKAEEWETNVLVSKYKIGTNINHSMPAIIERLSIVKEADAAAATQSMLQPARATVSLWRRMLGLSGRPYNKWSDSKVVPADIFDYIQWLCLCKVHHVLATDQAYSLSPEAKQYEALVARDKEVRRLALLEDYKVYRDAEILQWSSAFRSIEIQMVEKALETANHCMEVEIERLAMMYMRVGANEVVTDVSHEEQKHHENRAAVLDEALDWVCIDVLESVYEFYVSSLLSTMWERPELRKGLLQYSGLLKSNRSTAFLRNVLGPIKDGPAKKDSKASANDDKDWYPAFFAAALEEEKKLIPMEASVATTIIQARVRGVLARKQARKQFAGTFYKKWDAESGMCYYVNSTYNTTSWTKPAIHSILFPNGKW